MTYLAFPVSIERQCNLSCNLVEPLNAGDSLSSHARAMDAVRRRNMLKSDILGIVYKLGDSENREIRNSARSLQRSVSKDQIPNRKDWDSLTKLTSASEYEALDAWMQAHVAEAECERASESEYDAALERGRHVLAQLLDSDTFSAGIHASNRRLYSQFASYAQAFARGSRVDKKLRQTEDSLISYLFRAMSKPSPFGGFTSIYAASDSPKSSPGRTRQARVSRDILLWMEHMCCHKLEDVSNEIPLRLNRTIKIEEGQISAFVRGLNGTPQMLGGERFIKLKASGFVLKVMELVSSGGMSASRLRTELEFAYGASARQKIEQVSNGLITAGIIERDFGIADNEPHFPARAQSILGAIECDGAAAMSAVFSAVERVEAEISSAATARRPSILKELESSIARVAELSETALQSIDAIQSIYFEDVGGGQGSPSDSLSTSDVECLGRLIPALKLFDDQLCQRQVLKEFFESQTASAKETLPLLDFYRRFRELGNEEIIRRMLPGYTQAGRDALARRAEFIELVGEAVERAPASGVVDLDHDAFNDWLTRLPTVDAAGSHSVFVQRACDDGNRWILNNAGTGHCASMSRFVALFGGEDSAFVHSMKESLKAAHPGENLVDILGVFGANSNIHPLLTDSALLYPGSCASHSDSVIHPSDIEVHVDSADGRLTLRTSADGKSIDLISLNFLHPASGPLFYRFLHAFTPYWGFKSTDIADQFTRVAHAPRIKYGPVILMRETFNVVAESIQAKISDTASERQNFIALDEWRKSLGIPRRVYFRVPHPYLGFVPSDVPSIEAMLTLRRGRLRKPHLIDFENPFLVRVFAKQLSSMEASRIVQFQEALPDHSVGGLKELPVREHIFQLDKRV